MPGVSPCYTELGHRVSCCASPFLPPEPHPSCSAFHLSWAHVHHRNLVPPASFCTFIFVWGWLWVFFFNVSCCSFLSFIIEMMQGFFTLMWLRSIFQSLHHCSAWAGHLGPLVAMNGFLLPAQVERAAWKVSRWFVSDLFCSNQIPFPTTTHAH